MQAPKLDLMLLETYSEDTFSLADISQYPTNFSISNPTMEITPPGSGKINVSFTPQSANIYRASDLGIVCDEGCIPLPDGFYTVKYSVAPNGTHWIEKQFLRTTAIWEKYKKAFLKIDLNPDYSCSKKDKVKQELMTIQLFINGATAAANICDQNSSYNLYTKADKMLDRILLDCCQTNSGYGMY